jgi:hypothetical protein
LSIPSGLQLKFFFDKSIDNVFGRTEIFILCSRNCTWTCMILYGDFKALEHRVQETKIRETVKFESHYCICKSWKNVSLVEGEGSFSFKIQEYSTHKINE